MGYNPPNDQNNAAAAIPVYLAGSPVGASSTTLNITTATVIKAAPGTLIAVAVIVAGSAPGTCNDCLTTGAAAPANQFGTIPASVNRYEFGWPCQTGIVVVPGTGQTLAVSWQ